MCDDDLKMNATGLDGFDEDKDFVMDADGGGWDDMEEQDDYIPIGTNHPKKRPTKNLIFANIHGVYREEPLHVNREFTMKINVTDINEMSLDDFSKLICQQTIGYTLITKSQNLFVREWIKGITANGMQSNIYHNDKVKNIKLINVLQMIDDYNVNIKVSIALYGANPKYCIKIDHDNLAKFNKQVCPNLDCDHDTKQNSNDGINIIGKCDIYSNMLQNDKYSMTINNYNHMNKYYHGEKKACKFGTNCEMFIRVEAGGNTLHDKCHLILFAHPPRNKQIKLPPKFNPFVYDENYQTPAKLYVPTNDEYEFAVKHQENGYLKFLLVEVLQNGFIKDLMCRKNVKVDSKELIKLILNINEIDINNYNKYIPLLSIVDEKLLHPRHIAMGCPLRRDEMLSLIMYTGCDSNYDLCKTQRNGDFIKWKWFDLLLSSAIRRLNNLELASHSIYSGINGVLFDKTDFRGAFITYTSTSWDKNVAIAFKGGNENGNKGVLLEFDNKMRGRGGLKCCDVSWISKFRDEKEILFGRNLGWYDRWKAVIVKQYGSNQIVKLTLTH